GARPTPASRTSAFTNPGLPGGLQELGSPLRPLPVDRPVSRKRNARRRRGGERARLMGSEPVTCLARAAPAAAQSIPERFRPMVIHHVVAPTEFGGRRRWCATAGCAWRSLVAAGW